MVPVFPAGAYRHYRGTTTVFVVTRYHSAVYGHIGLALTESESNRLAEERGG